MKNKKKYVSANEVINKKVVLNPNSAEEYNSRGLVKSNLKDHRGAMEDYTRAIEIDPQYSSAYHNRTS